MQSPAAQLAEHPLLTHAWAAGGAAPPMQFMRPYV